MLIYFISIITEIHSTHILLQDLIIHLAEKIEKMQNQIQRLETCVTKTFEALKNIPTSSDGSVKQEGTEDACTINGINVMRLPARDAYAFGLQLLDILFTKEELGSSLLMKSKKSEKPGLDSARVQQLLSLIDLRFGDKWDIKTLTMKCNQKCRDSRDVARKSEA